MRKRIAELPVACRSMRTWPTRDFIRARWAPWSRIFHDEQFGAPAAGLGFSRRAARLSTGTCGSSGSSLTPRGRPAVPQWNRREGRLLLLTNHLAQIRDDG